MRNDRILPYSEISKILPTARTLPVFARYESRSVGRELIGDELGLKVVGGLHTISYPDAAILPCNSLTRITEESHLTQRELKPP